MLKIALTLFKFFNFVSHFSKIKIANIRRIVFAKN